MGTPEATCDLSVKLVVFTVANSSQSVKNQDPNLSNLIKVSVIFFSHFDSVILCVYIALGIIGQNKISVSQRHC